MSTISENATLKLTVGFALVVVAGVWKASNIVTAFEAQIRELQNKVTVLEAQDNGAVWQAMRNNKEELKQEIAASRQLVEHQVDDMDGDLSRLRDLIARELDQHHHHGGK